MSDDENPAQPVQSRPDPATTPGRLRPPDAPPYDPETSLEADEKLMRANLKAGAYKITRLGADGKEHEISFDEI